MAYVPRRKLVGNCASRNADADTGNPYERLWLFMSGVASESEELKGKEDSRRWESSVAATEIRKFLPERRISSLFRAGRSRRFRSTAPEDRVGDAVSW